MMEVAAQEVKPLLTTFGCPRPVPLLAGARGSAARCVLLPAARSCCPHRYRATATRSLELLFAARHAAARGLRLPARWCRCSRPQLPHGGAAARDLWSLATSIAR
ncbi:hypothetical protein Dimus_008133, partial [Dionaea muscipula]